MQLRSFAAERTLAARLAINFRHHCHERHATFISAALILEDATMGKQDWKTKTCSTDHFLCNVSKLVEIVRILSVHARLSES